ncbi:MAG: hypothetical protein QOG46_16 [Pseudonocardiales bacterium]|nr:hypothetical protein [Pseudonocardiales bacterium]
MVAGCNPARRARSLGLSGPYRVDTAAAIGLVLFFTCAVYTTPAGRGLLTTAQSGDRYTAGVCAGEGDAGWNDVVDLVQGHRPSVSPAILRLMEIDVRTVTDGEVAAWSAAVNTGFLSPTGDMDAEAHRPSLVLERTWGAFDGDTVVATLRSFRSQLTVPGGGALKASAITAVTTKKRPGEMSRPDYFWDIDFGILRYPSWPESKPGFHIVTRDPAGLVTGVARYRYEAKWEHRQPKGQVNVGFFLTDNPAAESLLWHHLLTVDLTASVRVEDRPADELLPLLLTDARHAWPSDRADFLCGSVRSTLPECSPPGPIWSRGGSSWRWWTPPARPGAASHSTQGPTAPAACGRPPHQT